MFFSTEQDDPSNNKNKTIKPLYDLMTVIKTTILYYKLPEEAYIMLQGLKVVNYYQTATTSTISGTSLTKACSTPALSVCMLNGHPWQAPLNLT